jgi:ribose 5-phosphate isomerase A
MAKRGIGVGIGIARAMSTSTQAKQPLKLPSLQGVEAAKRAAAYAAVDHHVGAKDVIIGIGSG